MKETIFYWQFELEKLQEAKFNNGIEHYGVNKIIFKKII
jgi:hypothetical protein